eukprot:gene9391-16078_t
MLVAALATFCSARWSSAPATLADISDIGQTLTIGGACAAVVFLFQGTFFVVVHNVIRVANETLCLVNHGPFAPFSIARVPTAVRVNVFRSGKGDDNSNSIRAPTPGPALATSFEEQSPQNEAGSQVTIVMNAAFDTAATIPIVAAAQETAPTAGASEAIVVHSDLSNNGKVAAIPTPSVQASNNGEVAAAIPTQSIQADVSNNDVAAIPTPSLQANVSNNGEVAAAIPTPSVQADSLSNVNEVAANTSTPSVQGDLSNVNEVAANTSTPSVQGNLSNNGEVAANTSAPSVQGEFSNVNEVAANTSTPSVQGDLSNVNEVAANTSTPSVQGDLSNVNEVAANTSTPSVQGDLSNDSDVAANTSTPSVQGDLSNDEVAAAIPTPPAQGNVFNDDEVAVILTPSVQSASGGDVATIPAAPVLHDELINNNDDGTGAIANVVQSTAAVQEATGILGAGTRSTAVVHTSETESNSTDVINDASVAQNTTADTTAEPSELMSPAGLVTYEALFLKVAASKDEEVGAAKIATLLKTTGLSQKILRDVWNASKKAPDVPHGAKGKMNFNEFVVACKLTVEAGGSFASSSEA